MHRKRSITDRKQSKFLMQKYKKKDKPAFPLSTSSQLYRAITLISEKQYLATRTANAFISQNSLNTLVRSNFYSNL
jgi:hypothetical protein